MSKRTFTEYTVGFTTARQLLAAIEDLPEDATVTECDYGNIYTRVGANMMRGRLVFRVVH